MTDARARTEGERSVFVKSALTVVLRDGLRMVVLMGITLFTAASGGGQ